MWLNFAKRWPSVPTKVTILLFSSEVILKYNPFKKYLVSSLEIANLVLSNNLKSAFEFILILIPEFFWSIIGKSSFGKHARENLDPSARKVNNFPSLVIISISLFSSIFLTSCTRNYNYAWTKIR